MMEGVSGLIDSSGDGAAASKSGGANGGGSGGGSEVGGFETVTGGGYEEGERSSGGNRWPRQETLALLKIRSDMDVAFRESSLKGPLWEEVSRKMAEFGYNRNSKKCKEKFENVYKYHKRTKEGRASKSDGKTYRFFDQLEALDNHPSFLALPPPPGLQATIMETTTMAMAMNKSSNPPIVSQSIVSSMIKPINVSQNVVNVNPVSFSLPQSQPTRPPQPPSPTTTTSATIPSQSTTLPTSHPNMSAILMSYPTSSSTSSDEQPERRGKGKRKRKLKDFFERLMKEMVVKQEELQKRFLENFEKRELERMTREEAWRVQEMARLNREHDLLVQERLLTAARNATVIAFLQRVTVQHNTDNPNAVPQMGVQIQLPKNTLAPPLRSLLQPPPPPPPVVQPLQQTPPPAVQILQQTQPPPAVTQLQQVPFPTLPAAKHVDARKTDNGGDSTFSPKSSSRWPKAEIQALIQLRKNLDLKYDENGPKGPLWEEISTAMGKLGYNRNSKRCKEKWENINKYFKKVKERNKKRPEDAKTCPYFHQLDALYKEKAKTDGVSFTSGFVMKPENPMAAPIMVQPEQQWPLPQSHQPDDENESDNSDMIENNEDGEDEDEEEDGGGYEVVANRPSSSVHS